MEKEGEIEKLTDLERVKEGRGREGD